MSELADRFNSGKPQWTMVDFDALEPMVRVLDYGARKYSPHNWKKGLPYTQVVDSLMRHIIAFVGGEDIDQESGLPHVGHISCNAMFLSHMAMFRPDMDDRLKSCSPDFSESEKVCCGNWDELGQCTCAKYKQIANAPKI